jgi:RNA polymerase sigma-70 factor (ECF subfamily)
VRDEESLIRRAQQRDQVALTQIYEENFDKIYRYVVLKIGDRAEAEDMTQQVFLNALKSIDRYKFKGMPFSSWLFRIAHNQVVDYYRKKGRATTVPIDDVILPGYDNPGRDAERKMEIEEVKQATQQLTSAQREVISLRFAGELSIAEVARVMGKSEGAIKALQHAAIISLRKIMSAGAGP